MRFVTSTGFDHMGFHREVHHLRRPELRKHAIQLVPPVADVDLLELEPVGLLIGARFSRFPAYVSLSTTQTASGVSLMTCRATTDPINPAPLVTMMRFMEK